jgi:hypothetical protein
VIDVFTVLDRLPTPTEHRRLAEAVGWAAAFDWDTMPASLDGSLAGVVALDGDRVIGMGRLVGDGANYQYSTNHQVVIHADTQLVVAVGTPLPGNRNGLGGLRRLRRRRGHPDRDRDRRQTPRAAG